MAKPLKEIKINFRISRKELEQILFLADKLENELGQAQMWNTLRPGFSCDELLENLMYIAKENDM